MKTKEGPSGCHPFDFNRFMKRVIGLESPALPNFDLFLGTAEMLGYEYIVENIEEIKKNNVLIRSLQILRNITATAMLHFFTSQQFVEGMLCVTAQIPIYAATGYIASQNERRMFRAELAIQQEVTRQDIGEKESDIIYALTEEMKLLDELRKLNYRPQELVFWQLIQSGVIINGSEDKLPSILFTILNILSILSQHYLARKIFAPLNASAVDSIIEVASQGKKPKSLKESDEKINNVILATIPINIINILSSLALYIISSFNRGSNSWGGLLAVLAASFSSGFPSITSRLQEVEEAAHVHNLTVNSLNNPDVIEKFEHLLTNPKARETHLKEEPPINLTEEQINNLTATLPEDCTRAIYIDGHLFYVDGIEKDIVLMLPQNNKPTVFFGASATGKSSTFRMMTHQNDRHSGLVGTFEKIDGKWIFTDIHSNLDKIEGAWESWDAITYRHKNGTFLSNAGFKNLDEMEKYLYQHDTLRDIFYVLLNLSSEDLAEKDVGEYLHLSEGQRRVLNIVSSVIQAANKQKKFMLIDEPFSGLEDLTLTPLLINYLTDVQKESGMNIFLQIQQQGIIEKIGLDKINLINFNNKGVVSGAEYFFDHIGPTTYLKEIRNWPYRYRALRKRTYFEAEVTKFQEYEKKQYEKDIESISIDDTNHEIKIPEALKEYIRYIFYAKQKVDDELYNFFNSMNNLSKLPNTDCVSFAIILSLLSDFCQETETNPLYTESYFVRFFRLRRLDYSFEKINWKENNPYKIYLDLKD